MTTQRYQDGEAFIRRLEQAQEEGDADAVSRNIERLRKLIADLQSRSHELAQLQYRAPSVFERHEPAADQRTGDPKLDGIVGRIEEIMRREPPDQSG